MKRFTHLYCMASLLLLTTLACERPRAVPLADGDLERASTWTPGGIIAYVGAGAFDTYSSRGRELLNAAYGGPVEVTWSSNSNGVLLAPKSFSASLVEDGQGLSLHAEFTSNLMTNGVHDCATTWSPGDVSLTVQFVAQFDSVGSLDVIVAQQNIVVAEGYTDGTTACSPSDLSTWQSDYIEAATLALSDLKPLRQLAIKMLGGNKGYALKAGPQTEILTAPSPIASEDSITEDMLVRLSSVAVIDEHSACIPANIADSASPQPTTTLPAPAIDLKPTSDWAFAWRMDLLQYTIQSLFLSGVFCRYDGLTRPSFTAKIPMTAEQLGVELPSTIPTTAELGWSIEPATIPSLDIDNDGSVRLHFESVRIRIFIIRWSMPHLMMEYTGTLTLDSAALHVRDNTLEILGGTWTTHSDAPYFGELVSRAADLSGVGLPLGTIQANFPFKTIISHVSRTEHHVVAWCSFDDTTPPIPLAEKTAQMDLSSVLSPHDAAAPIGCSQPFPTNSSPGPWFALILLALTGLLRRVIVPEPKETSA